VALRSAERAAQDGPHELSETDELDALAAQVGERCLAAAATLGAAESCTGGLVLHLLTETPGASRYVEGGAITYSDRLKHDLLGVPVATLERHGAVSAQVAVAMAEGARSRLSVSHAVAVTGIAGPTGDTPEKPVGLTYIAVADRDGHDVRRYQWHGDRSANKRESARAALLLLLERLPPPG
jgi:PncC family amidohydrolase